jgi:PPK2 family polyphosphate:nucleotide phosphotransferase
MNWSKQFRVQPGRQVRLAEWDAADTAGWTKDAATAELARARTRLMELQHRLYAENQRALLVVLQGMDAAGKDGVIRHVLSAFNPQGCRVTSFKAPSTVERAHDFLWRIHRAVPARGEIGVFNRSHYEDVLIVRVRGLAPKAVWSKRYRRINEFEALLAENGVRIVKFFLHITNAEQRDRLQARLSDPTKNWKFDPADLAERKLWPDYQRAYEVALSRCSTAAAPWFIIPANKKWFRNLAAALILVETLEDMDPRFPKPVSHLSRIVVK